MARDITLSELCGGDEFLLGTEDEEQEPAAKSKAKSLTTVSISLPTTSTTAPTLVLPDTNKIYKFSSDRRGSKAGSKKSRKKRGKKASSQPKEYSYAVASRTKRRRRQIVYRIDTSTSIRLYASRKQARLAEKHYERDVKIIRYGELFLKLREKQDLILHGIRPGQVQVMADGSIAIQLTIVEKREHSYSAVYTVDSFEEVRRKVRDGVPGATLGYTSKNPEVLRHILDCLNVHYTDSEFTTLVAKMNDSIRYAEQVEQEVRMSRRGIFFSKRIAKSEKLLGPKDYGHHRKGRAKRSAKLLGPERRK